MTDQTAARIGQVYTLAEAARLTGLSVDALRKRIGRGQLEKVPGNNGVIRVRLTTADLEDSRMSGQLDQPKSGQTSQIVQPKSGHDGQDDRTIAAMQEHLSSLRERLASADQEAIALRSRIGEIERERDGLRQEREDARVRAAGAEGEAKALREALAEARRPAWRRWLGMP